MYGNNVKISAKAVGRLFPNKLFYNITCVFISNWIFDAIIVNRVGPGFWTKKTNQHNSGRYQYKFCNHVENFVSLLVVIFGHREMKHVKWTRGYMLTFKYFSWHYRDWLENNPWWPTMNNTYERIEYYWVLCFLVRSIKKKNKTIPASLSLYEHTGD